MEEKYRDYNQYQGSKHAVTDQRFEYATTDNGARRLRLLLFLGCLL
jgi:hypothetical protein